MKRILGLIAFFVGFCAVASATEIKLPPMQAGAYYSFKDHAVNAVSTFEAVKIKDLVALELGVAGDSDKADWKGVVAVSIDIKQLHLGNYVTFPILDLVQFRPALVVGLGHINGQDLSGAKIDYGLGATILNLKW